MFKKMLWLVILVLIAACGVYVSNGGLSVTDVTSTAAPTTAVSTIAVNDTAVIDLTATDDGIIGDQGGLLCENEATATVAATNSEVPTGTTVFSATPTTAATTVAATNVPTEANTNTPTATTASSTFTPTAIPPTVTPSFTPTPTTTPLTFALQSGSPSYVTNFVHTGKGCNWSGVAGQVFDNDGNPLSNYVIKVTGKYKGVAVSLVAMTGMVSGTPYGPGSYEVVLGSSAVDSTGLLFIQLFDPNGKALTEKISFNTYADCKKNLAIINFKQN
jgi:hypothetical protein